MQGTADKRVTEKMVQGWRMHTTGGAMDHICKALQFLLLLCLCPISLHSITLHMASRKHLPKDTWYGLVDKPL